MTVGHTHLDTRAFRASFGGEIVTAHDDTYDVARAIWNGMIDKHPELIARCHTVQDIVAAVNFARESGLNPAIRGGGHSIPGLSSSDGMVIDLSPMRRVHVDPTRRVAVVEPGAQWAHYDAATAAHGLASTGGLISSTGVAGLTLGGGIGWLQRKYGLACDNLIAADVVTAAGELVHTSETVRPELLWGLRGGGGNFGVVASFEFSLHPVATVLGGLMMFSWERARDLFATFDGWSKTLPDDGSMLAAAMTAPPEPFVPAELVGRPVAALVGCWCGDIDEGQRALNPLRALSPAVDLFGPMPYPMLQGMLDAGAPRGTRSYFRSGYAAELSDGMIDSVVEHGAKMPSPMSQFHLHQMGGAVARVASEATAYGARDTAFAYHVVTMWADPSDDAVNIESNRAFTAALAPHSTGSVYVNFLGDEGADRIRAAYGGQTYDRLAQLKREYDPENLFRLNQNVPPAQ
jgi:FAD/FMN-containing dehydrogenase